MLKKALLFLQKTFKTLFYWKSWKKRKREERLYREYKERVSKAYHGKGGAKFYFAISAMITEIQKEFPNADLMQITMFHAATGSGIKEGDTDVFDLPGDIIRNRLEALLRAYEDEDSNDGQRNDTD